MVSRIDGIKQIYSTTRKSIGDLINMPGGVFRFAIGAIQFTVGAALSNKIRHDGEQRMEEGIKRFFSPATSMVTGLIGAFYTGITGKNIAPEIKNFGQPDVNKDFLSDAWAARREKIKAQNANNDTVRQKGAARILYGLTAASLIEGVKGVFHALHGITAVGTGSAKTLAGIVTGNKTWKDNGVSKIAAGTSMIISGLSAPIAAPTSLIIEGAHNIATGHRALRTHKSLKRVENAMVMKGAGKLNPIAEDGILPKPVEANISTSANLANIIQAKSTPSKSNNSPKVSR